MDLRAPTYLLFSEMARRCKETRLRLDDGFSHDLAELQIPENTTLAAIVNPKEPTGGTFDTSPLLDLAAALAPLFAGRSRDVVAFIITSELVADHNVLGAKSLWDTASFFRTG